MKGELHNNFEDQVRGKLEHFEEYPPQHVLERIKATSAGGTNISGGSRSPFLWIGLVVIAAALTAGILLLGDEENKQVSNLNNRNSGIQESELVNPTQSIVKSVSNNRILVEPESKSGESNKKPLLNRRNKEQLAPEAGTDMEVCGLTANLHGTLSVNGSVGRWEAESSSVSFISRNEENPESDPEAVIKVSEYGIYLVRWTESINKDVAFDELRIHFKEVPEVTLGEDQAVCGIECELTSGGVNGFWKAENGIELSNPFETVTKVKTVSSGDYKLIWTENKDVCASSDTILLTFIDQPIAEIKMVSSGACYTSPVELSCLYNDGYTYEWNFDAGKVHDLGKENYLVTWNSGNSHNVRLTVSNKESCESFAELSIELPNRFEADFSYLKESERIPAMVYFTNHTTRLEELASSSGTEFLWDFGDGSTSSETHPDHLYKKTGAYSVKLIARDVNGCSDTIKGQPFEFRSETTVAGSDKKYFSPNGDGRNDIFRLEIAGILDFKASILSGAGNGVYEWNDPQGGWDGTLKGGGLAEQGLYYYVVRGRNEDGNPVEIPGVVYLKRD
jgi:gliding motility-associated-like protein